MSWKHTGRLREYTVTGGDAAFGLQPGDRITIAGDYEPTRLYRFVTRALRPFRRLRLLGFAAWYRLGDAVCSIWER